MNTTDARPTCPHCDEELQFFDLPPESGWEGGLQLACFNDECPYYQRGWDWMKENYGVTASYRFRIDPTAHRATPLAVWSETAIKDRILAAPESGE